MGGRRNTGRVANAVVPGEDSRPEETPAETPPFGMARGGVCPKRERSDVLAVVDATPRRATEADIPG